jgi:hypothetical protein
VGYESEAKEWTESQHKNLYVTLCKCQKKNSTEYVSVLPMLYKFLIHLHIMKDSGVPYYAQNICSPKNLEFSPFLTEMKEWFKDLKES